jgi:murein DD-endopeptidase MepM/ murein hydrolase activator NlpD
MSLLVQKTAASSPQNPNRMRKFGLALILLATLAACGTPSGSDTNGTAQPSGPGYYAVQKGDTLSSIARKFRLSNSDIISWNKLSDPNDIKVEQVLRVAPQGARAGSKTTPRSVDSSAASAAAGAANDEQNAIDWTWPASGQSASGLGQGKKGMDIFGELGQPVLAAAAGKVMYSGSGIRGYGNLVIIKHDSNLLSIYAHNKTIVVKEGQMVGKGQKIAEMGKTDSNSVKLYFEIRRQGKPVDPSRYLPSR